VAMIDVAAVSPPRFLILLKGDCRHFGDRLLARTRPSLLLACSRSRLCDPVAPLSACPTRPASALQRHAAELRSAAGLRQLMRLPVLMALSLIICLPPHCRHLALLTD
jgi:hypothetical protein